MIVTDPAIVLKHPSECSDQELESYTALVLQGGEVVVQGLRGRIRQAAVLAFAFHESRLVAVTALKVPTEGYRLGVFRKAGVALSAAGALELGWVFVVAGCRGRGLAGRIVTDTLSPAGTACVFATTRSDNSAMHKVLEARCGFR